MKEEQQCRQHTPSKIILVPMAVLTFILVNGDLPPIGYVLGFGLFCLLLVADYALYLQKEEVEHGA